MNDLSEYRTDVQLRNGQCAVVRSIKPADKQLLLDGFRRMSEQSAYNRFFGPKEGLSETELQYLTQLDFDKHVAIVLIMQEQQNELLVGVGRYLKSIDESVAECAFSVDDSHQNMGIGTILFEHLIAIAQEQGIKTLRAELLVENNKMLEIFQHSDMELNTMIKDGIITIELSIVNSNFKRFY